MNQIINDVAKGLGELGKETLERTVEETGKIFEPIITAQELLGGISTMSDEEMKNKQAEDEKHKQQEMAKLRSEMGQGRNLDEEIERIRREREEQENQEEKVEEQEEIREERMEAEEGQILIEPQTKKRGPGAGMAKGKNGKASQSDMSATNEYTKKPD